MPVVEWLTIREAADRFDLSPSTIRWHCREDRGLLHYRAKRVTNHVNRYMVRADDMAEVAALLHGRRELLARRIGRRK